MPASRQLRTASARLGTDRIDEADQAEKGQVVKLPVEWSVGGRRCGLPAGDGENPVAGGRHRLGGGEAGGADRFSAERDEDFRRAFRVDAVVAFAVVEHGGEAALGGEGHLAGAPAFPANGHRIEPRLDRHDQEGEVDGVAGAARGAELRHEFGVVAEDGRAGELPQRFKAVHRQWPAAGGEAPGQFLAAALDIDDAVTGKPDAFGRELVDGEGAGLVGGDDRAGAEALDGGKVADDDVAAGHAPRGDRQRHRHRHGQAFRNDRHGKRDTDEERLARHGAAEKLDRDDGKHDGHRSDAENLREAVEAAGEGRWRRSLRQRLGNAAELRRHPGGDDQRLGAASMQRGAGVEHVAALGERRILRQDAIRLLGDRHRLAGERRFIGLQIGALEKPEIGGHALARFQHHDVARHQIGAFHGARPAVPDDPTPGDENGTERGGVLLRAGFLERADRRVHHQHDGDEQRVVAFAKEDRDRAGGNQQIDQRAPQLRERDEEDGAPLRLGQDVAAVARAAGFRLRRRQTGGGRVEAGERRAGVERMPGRCGFGDGQSGRGASPPRT